MNIINTIYIKDFMSKGCPLHFANALDYLDSFVELLITKVTECEVILSKMGNLKEEVIAN